MLPGIEGMAGASGSTAAAVSSPIDFAVLSKGSDQAITENTKITFSGVAYGDASMFSNASDTLTVSGALARISGGFFQTNTRSYFRKGGALFPGYAEGVASNQGRRSFGSAPIAISDGDSFDFYTEGTSGTHAGQPWTWLAVETMDPATKYCVAKLASNLSVSAGTATIGWDGTDIADAYAMHSPSSNNSRITVPTGVTLARPFFQLRFASVGVGERSCWVDMSGATYNGRPLVDIENETGAVLCGYGAIVPVTGGTDYFSVSNFNEADGTLVAIKSHFGVECFASNYSYCTAYESATQAITASTAATLLLESEVADTDNCHSTASSQGNFVVPSGKTKARMSFGIKTANDGEGNSVWAEGQLNGSPVQGLPSDGRANDNDQALNGFGSWITVAPGDVLRVRVTASASQTLPASGETWVCVEWA